MPPNRTVEEVTDLLTLNGARQYGQEAVSQLEHALQCAALAEQAGEGDAVIVAALLHDVGHLVAPRRDAAPDAPPSRDDLHQYIALPFLRSLFPAAVLEPIRLHVDAKRYLCLADAAYWESLSPASRHSLELQGGVFSADEAQAFIAEPFAPQAVRLRRYDDLAKAPGLRVPDLLHYTGRLTRIAR
ncbi:MAG TPA: HD domain-containing protein [Ramlibacter sp.]|nr:HD domain-containing protein [Ramlibacter sp.]